MKKCVILVLLLAFVAMAVHADESSCPAKRAGDKGFNSIEAFHHVLGPTWHKAWPNKDYDALIAAGPKFEETFGPIAELKMTFKTEKRADAFTKNRDEFAKLVKLYGEACKDGNKEKVYELMPALHDAFEMTASAMLPVHYPEFDGFVISMNMIMESHMPQNNTEGIIGSTETLVAKVEGLTEETIPEDLKEKQAEIMAIFAAMKELTTKMKECCDKNDMETYKIHIEHLNTKVNEFHTKYI